MDSGLLREVLRTSLRPRNDTVRGALLHATSRPLTILAGCDGNGSHRASRLTLTQRPRATFAAIRTRLHESRSGAMKSLLQRFVRDESGATAVEYGLVAAGISVAIIAILNTLSGQLKSAFSDMLKSGR